MPKTNLSARSTKQELLGAYEELMQELENRDMQQVLKTSNHGESASTDKKIITQPEEVIAHLGDVRIQINKNLGQIVDQLVAESEKLHTMQAQEQELRQEIERLHQIKVHASTLQNLIALKEEEKQTLEKNMQDQRSTWEVEQQQQELAKKEVIAEQAKQRKRDEEEYVYTLRMKRQKDEDEYQEKRRKTELVLQEREKRLTEEETTHKDLQKQVADLEKQLVTAVAQTRTDTEERVTSDLKTAHTLEMKGIEGERNLSKLTVTNLDKSIQAQEAEIKDLKVQLIKATQQIKDIAISVIEIQKPVQSIAAAPQQKNILTQKSED